jgi:hypothetical protein
MAVSPELLIVDIRDELDWERERLVANRFRRSAALLREQVEHFPRWVETLEGGD